MITTTRYTTKSGSIYDVKRIREAADTVYVRRVKLGEKHLAKGPTQVARRNEDNLDGFRKVVSVSEPRIGGALYIALSENSGDNLITSPVVSIEEA